MEMKKWIAPLAIVALLGVASLSGCAGAGTGSVQAIETMSEADFSKWKLYMSLGTKIAVNRLLAEGVTTEEELEKYAVVLETLRDKTVVPSGQSFIRDALADAGLTNDEIELVLVVVEQELLSRGALEWINTTTGLVEWSPRTKDLLTVVAKALRSATVVTEQEVEQGKTLQSELNGKLMQ